jgi:hypothetical protein
MEKVLAARANERGVRLPPAKPLGPGGCAGLDPGSAGGDDAGYGSLNYGEVESPSRQCRSERNPV